MRVYVTGGRGFVGRHLERRLRALGLDVLGCDAGAAEVDVTDRDAIRRALDEAAPDAVVHLAAQSSVARSFAEPASSFRVNYLGAVNLLDAVAAQPRRPRVLLVGSADQYGGRAPGSPPLRESDALRPASPYARSKAAAELLGRAAIARGADVVAVRAFNHSGPGQAPHFVAASFAEQLAQVAAGRRAPVLRVGNLASVRDLLHVDDVVDAYAALLTPDAPPGVYNVASGRPHAIRELLDALVAAADVDVAIEVDPARVRPTDQLTGDAAKLRAATGWEPAHDLAALARALTEDFRARVAASAA
ncbi:MAG: GDP-mannose 4,6-dehydratase [Myxococcota bacterium]